MQNLLNRIRKEQGEFPPAQRLVAAYVVENYNQIPFLSITALAKNIGVSDNTVVKFCNHLGYGKFTEFKRVFADYAHSELVMFNKVSEGGEEDILSGVGLEEDIAAIRMTLTDATNRENVTKLLDMMDEAHHIYVMGGRASGIMAMLFANMLRYLGLKVYDIAFGVGDYLDRNSMVEKEDLVIAFSFPRYTSYVVSELEELHRRDVPIVLITDTGLSPAIPYAELILQCAVSTGGYFPCYSSCLSLINAISRLYSITRKKKLSGHLHQLERRLLDRGIFL